MRVAIMQPYLFAHLPYYQLMQAADVFVIYDTVPFIRQGWMNRNRVLGPNGAMPFVFSVGRGGLDAPCAALSFDPKVEFQVAKLKRGLAQVHGAGGRARLEAEVFPLLGLIRPGAGFVDVAEATLQRLSRLCTAPPRILRASAIAPRGTASAQDHVIELCRALGGDHYINAIGGQALYDAPAFAAAGLTLSFLEPRIVPPEGVPPEIAGLSVIEWLARLEPPAIAPHLDAWRLITPDARAPQA